MILNFHTDSEKSASLNVSYMRCRSGESSGSAAKRVLARLMLSQQDLPPWKSFGEPIRPGDDIKVPVPGEFDVDGSGDDEPTAALESEGAVGTQGRKSHIVSYSNLHSLALILIFMLAFIQLPSPHSHF